MKKLLTLVFLCSLLGAGTAIAAGPSIPLDRANIDLKDQASLQRGAGFFFQYCVGCHSLEFARYNRIGRDLGLSDEYVIENLIHTTNMDGDPTGIGEQVHIAMRASDAEEWFAQPAPDLTLTARLHGPDWIYTVLRSFYLDDSRPLGVNNAAFENMGMPHVLWNLQGWQRNVGSLEDPQLEMVSQGALSTEEYDQVVRDITAFLTYIGEPVRLERTQIGMWVIAFLILFTFLAYLLKKEYWRDVH